MDYKKIVLKYTLIGLFLTVLTILIVFQYNYRMVDKISERILIMSETQLSNKYKELIDLDQKIYLRLNDNFIKELKKDNFFNEKEFKQYLRINKIKYRINQNIINECLFGVNILKKDIETLPFYFYSQKEELIEYGLKIYSSKCYNKMKVFSSVNLSKNVELGLKKWKEIK